MGYNIAIDGPAGAGKSTIAKLLSKKLGFIYVDTGAMYRALAYFFIKNGFNKDDETKICESVKKANVTLRFVDGEQQVFLNDENVTKYLRTEEVGNMASISSVFREVRAQIFDLQQTIAKENDVIMDGRDIGTVVLPNADLKIFLTASVEERAKRRYLELKEKGENPDIEKISQDIKERDNRDMTREIAPLKKADDAVLLDTSNMTIEEVVEKIASYVK